MTTDAKQVETPQRYCENCGPVPFMLPPNSVRDTYHCPFCDPNFEDIYEVS